MVAIFAIWGKFTFVSESAVPGVHIPMHSYATPLILTVSYLVSIPALNLMTRKYLIFDGVGIKNLLKESMIIYNLSQVILNGWMVYKFIDCVLNKGHPFIGDISTTHTGAAYVVWVHYCDKYLEFFDTIFMVLRGKTQQVSFLHIYHHFTIAWAWWIAMCCFPGGDAYFGALLNSMIHVLMYSYYTLSLLKIRCPWKKYLTAAQLGQFVTVNLYTFAAIYFWCYEPTVHINIAIAAVVQLSEMTSLFVLFYIFYRKSYAKKKI